MVGIWLVGGQGGRKACEQDPTFAKMEADMFNLVPAVGEVNGDRNNYRYAQAPKNMQYTQYGNCKVYTDFKEKRFYPADYSKGWIARAYLHMSQTYGINLAKAERQLMEAWNKMYPPSAWEVERTKIIKGEMGVSGVRAVVLVKAVFMPFKVEKRNH